MNPSHQFTTTTHLYDPALSTTTTITTTTTWSTAKNPFPPKFRLVPTSFENADAVVVVCPPHNPDAPHPRPLLFVGPALERLRHPHRPLAKGTRLHPYRIARSRLDRGQPAGSSSAKPSQSS